ncbi:MAG TPA: hypothetical protein VMS56_07250 [Thermoanaerobaculia bacterium]|nr:hypothetical protein [Thermoanaerobaculia bacterium]
MKRAFFVCIVFFLSVTAWAEGLRLERLPDEAGARLLRQWAEMRAEAQRTAQGVCPSLVLVDGSDFAALIPAAGNLPGAGGSFFRSDVTLANYGESDQEIRIVWLQRDTDGSAGVPTFGTTLPADVAPFTIRNFVGDGGLELSGLGAILIFAVDSLDSVDPNGEIDAYSRIWSPLPNASSGTVSQQFPAVNPDLLFDSFEGIALGLRLDEDYRSSAGIVNLDSVSHQYNILVIGDFDFVEFDVTVRAFSMSQVSVPFADLGDVSVVVTLLDDDPPFSWVAYATTNDNETSDGWVSLAGIPDF